MERTILIGIRIQVKVPRPPNFLVSGGTSIPVSQFTDDELRKVGAAMTEALLERAREMRESKEG